MSREINLQLFLDAAFGFHDSESGYGAQLPRSRDIRSFFEGRCGCYLPTYHSIITQTDYKTKEVTREIQKTSLDAAKLLAEDFRSLADQLDELISVTERDKTKIIDP